MTHCDLGNDPGILSVILQSDVKHIDLDFNNIDSSGAIKISEYLTGNPPVKYLDLENNDLDDNDAFLLSQALKKNTNLSVLDLHQNNFTSVGSKPLFVDKPLQLYESVCHIHIRFHHSHHTQLTYLQFSTFLITP